MYNVSTGWAKKWHDKLMAIVLANLNRSASLYLSELIYHYFHPDPCVPPTQSFWPVHPKLLAIFFRGPILSLYHLPGTLYLYTFALLTSYKLQMPTKIPSLPVWFHRLVIQCQRFRFVSRFLVLCKFVYDTMTWCVPSVLWRCWLGGRNGIRPVKNWVVGCWRDYLSVAICRLAYDPADATATHCLLLQ